MTTAARWGSWTVAVAIAMGCGGGQSKSAMEPYSDRTASAAGPAQTAYNPLPPAGPMPTPAPAPPSYVEPAPESADYEAEPPSRAMAAGTASSGGGNAAPAPNPAPQPPQPTPIAVDGKSEPATSAKRNLMLIYTANLTLAVFEAAKGLDAVETMAVEAGGYLVKRTDNQIIVRVPAAKFDGSLEAISKIGDELHRDVSVQDVTAEFRDLETQLRNLSAVRDRLERLLAKADKVQEALMVEQELTRVTGMIEQIKGRMKLIGELVAFSTISVYFQAQPVETITSAVKLPFPWLDQLGLTPLLDL